MRTIATLKRPFIWLKRIRHRCGYGVHSPFAFDLITTVFYEKTPYYAYRELRLAEAKMSKQSYASRKVKQLLFRLVNRLQPDRILDVGSPSSATLYLKAAKKNTLYTVINKIEDLHLHQNNSFDLLYIHQPDDPCWVEKAFYQFVKNATDEAVCIVEGIYYSREMKNLWSKFCREEAVRITFDLYDVGILLFDRKKIKQHYIINF